MPVAPGVDRGLSTLLPQVFACTFGAWAGRERARLEPAMFGNAAATAGPDAG